MTTGGLPIWPHASTRESAHHAPRRDFSGLGTVGEKVSPALEVDGLEAGMLTETDRAQQFRILVTTPEKLDHIVAGDGRTRLTVPSRWSSSTRRIACLRDARAQAGAPAGDHQPRVPLCAILLLTPFIRNGAEIAGWLSPDSNKSIDMGVDWTPKHRVVAIVRVDRGSRRGEFSLSLHTRHTTRNTLDIPEQIGIGEPRPLGLAWSKVKDSPGKIAATTAQVLQKRGTVIVLADTPTATWSIANTLKTEENKRALEGDELGHVQRFSATKWDRFPVSQLA